MKMIKLFTILAMSIGMCGCYAPSYDTNIQEQKLIQGRPAPELIPSSDKIVIISELDDRMRLRIITTGHNDKIAASLLSRVQDGLTGCNVSIVQDDSEDLILKLIPYFKNVSTLGDYHHVTCQIQASLLDRKGKNTFGSKTIDMDSKKSVLGADNAKEQYLKPAGKKLAAWTAEQLNKIKSREISATVVRFALAGSGTKLTRNQNAEKVLQIGEALSGIDGIVTYQLEEQDFTQGICSYRILYFKRRFPAGLGNAITHRMQNGKKAL